MLCNLGARRGTLHSFIAIVTAGDRFTRFNTGSLSLHHTGLQTYFTTTLLFFFIYLFYFACVQRGIN